MLIQKLMFINHKDLKQISLLSMELVDLQYFKNSLKLLMFYLSDPMQLRLRNDNFVARLVSSIYMDHQMYEQELVTKEKLLH